MPDETNNKAIDIAVLGTKMDNLKELFLEERQQNKENYGKLSDRDYRDNKAIWVKFDGLDAEDEKFKLELAKTLEQIRKDAVLAGKKSNIPWWKVISTVGGSGILGALSGGIF